MGKKITGRLRSQKRKAANPGEGSRLKGKARKAKAGRDASQQKVLDVLSRAEKITEREKEENSDYDEDEEAQEADDRGRVVVKKSLITGNDLDDSDEEHDFIDEEIDSDEAFGSDDDFEILDSKFGSFKHRDEDLSDYGDSVDEDELQPLSAVWDLDELDKQKHTGKKTEAEKPKKGLLTGLSLSGAAEDYGESETHQESDADVSDGSEGPEEEKSTLQLQDDFDEDEELSGGDTEDSDSEEDSEDSEEDSEGSEGESEEDLEAELDEVFGDDSGSEDEADSDSEAEGKLQQIVESISRKSETAPSKARKQLEKMTVPENELALPVAESDKFSISDMLQPVSGTPGAASALDSMALFKNKLKDPAKDTSHTLAVPLPKRIQQRHNRAAALEIAKAEVDQWQDIVAENRRAEHLQFPINPTVKLNDSTGFSTITQPASELESKVTDLLSQAKLLKEQDEYKFEQAAVEKLSKEELQKRTNELRLMRELMFREERKAKRIKKIKSKSYHKVHKRERERAKQLVEGSEDDEEHDIARARERMSLRHKNSTKWAKTLVNSGMSKDADARAELEEMMRRSQQLRTKILDDDGLSSDSDGEMAEQDGLEAERISHVKPGTVSQIGLSEFQTGDSDGGDSGAESDTGGQLRVVNPGRRVFAPEARAENEAYRAVAQQANVLAEEDVASGLEAKLGQKFNNKKSKEESGSRGVNSTNNTSGSAPDKGSNGSNGSEAPAGSESESEAANPWLSTGETSAKTKKVRKVVTAQSTREEKSLHRQEAATRKKRSARDVAEEDAAMISVESVLAAPVNDDEEAEDLGADEEGEMIELRHVKEFQQRELVKRAFAGDDVVSSDFAAEKRQTIEEEGDKEIDVTLPGWGSWGGAGVPQRKKFVKKVKGIKENKRKDAKLQDVIINERVNKKNSKFTVSGVPHPFETREQYEMSLRLPMGNEWSSRATHQRAVMPRVTVKTGTVIDPLKNPFKS